MDTKQPEWMNSSDLPSVFRDQILGTTAHVTKRYFFSAKGELNPARVKLACPFVIAIVGSGKGKIGASIALSYAQAGASGILLSSSRTEHDLKDIAHQIKSINPNCHVEYQVCDVRREDDLIQLASHCKASFGRLDVAVLNQAALPSFIQNPDGSLRFPNALFEEKAEDYTKSWDVNYHGTFLAIKALIPLMKASIDGPQSIIMISSIAALYSSSPHCTASYNMSKLALARLAEYVHAEYNSYGVNCFAVHPGCIQVSPDFPLPWQHCRF